MKKALLFCGLLMSAIMSGAQTPLDGEWFGKLGDLTQLAFIAGFMEGASTGIGAATLAVCADAKDFAACSRAVSAKSNDTYYKHLANLTPGQIHNGVKVFYADYRNVRMQVGYAIIHAGKSINGVPADELEKSLEAARRFSAGQR